MNARQNGNKDEESERELDELTRELDEFGKRLRLRNDIYKMGTMLGLAAAFYLSFPCKDARDSEEAKRNASHVAQQAGWEWANVEKVENSQESHPCEAGELAYRIWGINPQGNYSHGTVCCSLENIGDCPAVYDE